MQREFLASSFLINVFRVFRKNSPAVSAVGSTESYFSSTARNFAPICCGQFGRRKCAPPSAGCRWRTFRDGGWTRGWIRRRGGLTRAWSRRSCRSSVCGCGIAVGRLHKFLVSGFQCAVKSGRFAAKSGKRNKTLDLPDVMQMRLIDWLIESSINWSHQFINTFCSSFPELADSKRLDVARKFDLPKNALFADFRSSPKQFVWKCKNNKDLNRKSASIHISQLFLSLVLFQAIFFYFVPFFQTSSVIINSSPNFRCDHFVTIQSANLDALFIVKDANQKVMKDGTVANPVHSSAMVSFVANLVP